MDFETFAQSIHEQDCTDSSDDSNFESLPDNESFTQIDSDDEYVPNNRIASSTRKRMQTFDEHKVVKRRKTSSTTSGNRIERLPTRQPDPNVQNRNALMARENRRRKKEHVKVLEDQLEQKAQEIRCLRKILKQKDRTVKKLEHETLYLRSTIANKTDIMALLKTIRGNKLPLTSSALSFVAEDEHKDQRLNGSVSSRSPATSTATSFDEDEKENGTVTIRDDPFLTWPLNENEFSFSDYDLGFGQSTIGDDSLAMGDWRSLLNSDDDVKYIPQLSTTSDTQSLVNNEHNYYQQHTNWTSDERCGKDAGPGICLHLSGGRVSLEFCAACHSSSQNAWIEEM
ncbi:hypothetical protein HA402_004964 [Bradysia odoriphaga]|nr:hypothetical protein HA402_004964 [Bradysia odoriphaga]